MERKYPIKQHVSQSALAEHEKVKAAWNTYIRLVDVSDPKQDYLRR